MHGNDWEWCKDGQRTYDEQAQIDPLGPMTGDELPRVLRGGAWSGDAGRARSAIRYAYQPDDAIRNVGFRFCLRSIEPGQVTGSPAGKPGRATGGSLGTGRKGVKSKYKPDAKPKHRT